MSCAKLLDPACPGHGTTIRPLILLGLLCLPLAWPGAGQTESVASSGDGAEHLIPYFPSASDPAMRRGFVRVINHSTRGGEVEIVAIDDAGRRGTRATLRIGAKQTAHFNTMDLENGNTNKGLMVGTGATMHNWRLLLSSDLNIEVLAYIRTPDGFLTSMHDTVPVSGRRHRVAFFNPGSNDAQVSWLRLINPGDRAAAVTIRGIDDRGRAGRNRIELMVEPKAVRMLSAQALEGGGAGLNGALGDGAGKWRLIVSSNNPIVVMSLLESPTLHLTNLSSPPVLCLDDDHNDDYDDDRYDDCYDDDDD